MKKNAKHNIARAVLEALEGRTCMSGTVSLTNGVLLLQADPNLASVMQVQFQGNHNFVSAYTPYSLKSFPTSQIKKIVIVGSNKNDSIYIDPRLALPASISGGAGNDTIKGGTGFDTIDGGDGNDLIYAHGIIYTGAGNDTVWGSNNGDQIFGGSGNDLLIGGSGNDTIVGGSGNSTIIGGVGHDKLFAGQGNAVIHGGYGGVTLVGGPGHDTLYGGTAGNTLYGSNTTILHPGKGDVVSKQTAPTDPVNPLVSHSTALPPVVAPKPPVTVSPPPPATSTPSTPTTSVLKAVITQLESNIIAGEGVNVNALASTLSSAGPLNTRYQWNFGDPGSQYNDLTGWTAGHVYDKPGTYTITLQISDPSGATATATSQVTVAADTRPIIYVDSAGGSDNNDGSSPSSAVQSAARAFALAGSNTVIDFHRGESFSVNQSLVINGHDIAVGAYGTGADPLLVRGAGDGAQTIFVTPTSFNITVQGLTFDSIWPAVNGVADKISACGIWAQGKDLVVRGCTFLNVTDAVNGSMLPNGVILLDNSAPLQTGLRGYFAWVDGANWSILGNYVYNSTREHDIRGNDTAINGVLIYDNNLQHHNSAADPGEVEKTTIDFRDGSYIYIADNKLTNGTLAFAPGPGMDASEPVNWVVIEDNFIHDTQLYVRDYTHHMMVRDNLFDVTGTAQIHLFSGDSLDPNGFLSDITITHNTGINAGTDGQFLQLTGGDTTGGITVTDNLYSAPNLRSGVSVDAAVYVEAADLRAFKLFAGNIWPAASGANSSVSGAVNYIAGSTYPGGYVTASQWNAMTQVQDDLFQDVTLASGTYQTTLSGFTAGAVNFTLSTTV